MNLNVEEDKNIAEERLGLELSYIENLEIQEFTRFVLNKAPIYFWLVPSSSTGKHHPTQSNGNGGLVRHTRSAVYFANILCRAYNIEGTDKDLIISSVILHDIVKYGLVMQRYTTKTHDKEGALFIGRLGKEYPINPEYVDAICKGVGYHFGRWTDHEKAKKFPEEYTLAETIVHLADMVSAGKEVSLDFLQENLIG